MNVNHFIVGGNLTRDPELRRLPDGRAMTCFTVAVNQYANDGEQTYERCDFIPITSYGRQAENDAKFLGKGQEVLVECAVHSWYDEAKRKGGFNFEARKVHYGARSRGSPRQ